MISRTFNAGFGGSCEDVRGDPVQSHLDSLCFEDEQPPCDRIRTAIFRSSAMALYDSRIPGHHRTREAEPCSDHGTRRRTEGRSHPGLSYGYCPVCTRIE